MAKKKTTKTAEPEVTVMKRVFEFSGMVLEDPGTDKSPEEVKDLYSAHYPELVNADIKGPERNGGVEKWTFKARLAPKG
jgi:PRTRC system protein C